MLSLIKPSRLKQGDAIGIVSPSWGGPAAFPHRLKNGIQQLEQLGYRVKIGKHALNQQGFVSDTAINRAQDLHDFFLDPDVKLIMASIGGDHSCHLLQHLDFELIRQHPTALIGFSDISVLNLAIWTQTGLTTFNGPALLTDFAEFPNIFDYTLQSFLKTLTVPEPIGKITPAPWWTEEFLDWGQGKDLERPRQTQASPGWVWLRKGQNEKPYIGHLLGGCLESLQHLRGTKYWPDWQGAVLFIETSEEAPTPEKVDGILMDYENMGVFQHLNGLLVGRSMYYSQSARAQLHQILLERTQAYDFPIIAEMDFGHTAPQLTLPLGCQICLDGNTETLEIIEAAVI